MIENFGGNVARLRKNLGYSQEQLATKIGLNKQTISNIERGVRYPTFESLEKIATVLNANATQLFGTTQEVAISDTENVLIRMDSDDRIQAMMQFANVFNDEYLEEIDEAFHKTQYIYEMLTDQPLRDEDGKPIINDKGEITFKPSFYSTIPFDKIDSLVEKIHYIKSNQDLV